MEQTALVRILSDKYEQLKADITARNAEIDDEAKRRKAAAREELETEFGVEIVRALEAGVKRYEIEEGILGTREGKRYRRLVELGGGKINAYRTAEERFRDANAARLGARKELLEKIGWEELGVRADGEIWYQNQNGLEFWLRYDRNGRPYGVIDESIHPPEKWQEIHRMMREHKDEIREIKEGEVK